MTKTFVAKTTINLPDSGFYIRTGDMLMYDLGKLSIYRAGKLQKTIKTSAIALAGWQKMKWVEEVSGAIPTPEPTLQPTRTAKVTPPATPRASKPVVKASKSPKKEEVSIAATGATGSPLEKYQVSGSTGVDPATPEEK